MLLVFQISVFIFQILAFHTFLTESGPITSTISPSAAENKSVATTTTPKNDIVENDLSLSSQSNIKLINETFVAGFNSTTNSTNSNYVIEYKPLVFDSLEDIKTQQEWGGNCTLQHWDNCKALLSWFGNYEDPKDGEVKEYLIDCRQEPVLCLKNSWTVTRCNLLCMSRCNVSNPFQANNYLIPLLEPFLNIVF